MSMIEVQDQKVVITLSRDEAEGIADALDYWRLCEGENNFGMGYPDYGVYGDYQKQEAALVHAFSEALNKAVTT